MAVYLRCLVLLEILLGTVAQADMPCLVHQVGIVYQMEAGLEVHQHVEVIIMYVKQVCLARYIHVSFILSFKKVQKQFNSVGIPLLLNIMLCPLFHFITIPQSMQYKNLA